MEMYLVQYTGELEPGERETVVSLWSAARVLDWLDLRDCYDPGDEVAVYEVSEPGRVTPLHLWGAWHDPRRPLYLKATRPDGSIAFDGWGTDH